MLEGIREEKQLLILLLYKNLLGDIIVGNKTEWNIIK